jgi:hypothetical protein
MPERLGTILRWGWPRCFAAAVAALIVAVPATMLGVPSIAKLAGTIAWSVALVGTVLGLIFHARGDEVEW